MNALSTLTVDPTALALAFVAGLAAGAGFFLVLRRNTDLFAGGRIGLAIAMQVARFAVLVPVLVLAAALGVLIARRVVVGRVRRRSAAMLPDGGRSS